MLIFLTLNPFNLGTAAKVINKWGLGIEKVKEKFIPEGYKDSQHIDDWGRGMHT